VLLLSLSLGFFRMQTASQAAGNLGARLSGNTILYLAIIASEWALCLYIWMGTCRPGAASMRELIGGRWGSVKAVSLDVAIAAAFWLVWSLVAIAVSFVLRPVSSPATAFLNPKGGVEITLWVLMSMTAGFCEELIYRGYLQRQLLALTGSAALAVMLQAVIFGAGHWYQGGKKVIIISVLGVLFGLLAHWRKSLRPGMIAHAWEDVLNVIPIRWP
jgi:membrane protease YdiL (CAAX protease family)